MKFPSKYGNVSVEVKQVEGSTVEHEMIIRGLVFAQAKNVEAYIEAGEDRCGKCRFGGRQVGIGGPGTECRRRAPEFSGQGNNRTFPVMHTNQGWCGEYEIKGTYILDSLGF